MDTAGLTRCTIVTLALALTACAGGSRRPPAPSPAASAAYGPAPVVAGAATPPAAPPGPRPAPDQCGLSELRGVVGKSRLEIPIPLEPGRRRVVCETCPRSQDFVAGRQTVLFDARSGLVTSVSCG